MREVLAWGIDYLRRIVRPIIEFGDLRLRAHPTLSLQMRRLLYDGGYERNELAILRARLEPMDRVLELGTGLGLLSTYSAKVVGSDRVTTFEANPAMEQVIRENFRLNGVSPRLELAAVGSADGTSKFHIRRNFYAGSLHGKRAEGAIGSIQVPVRSVDALVKEIGPTLLICDVEGEELNLFAATELPGVRALLIEVHPELIGDAGVATVRSRLEQLEFRIDAEVSTDMEWFLKRS